jgi:hypothetical protein
MTTPALPLQTLHALPLQAMPALSLQAVPALPLQAADSLTAFEYGLLAIEAVTVAFGLAIAYIAVQGYRRNDSQAMAFVAAGFVMLVGVPTVLSVFLLFTPLLPQAPAAVVISTSEAIGMASILYGLRGPATS